MLRAELRIEGPAAGTAAAAISPEAGRELPRTSTEIIREDGAAVIRITASDTSAMRAAVNSSSSFSRIHTMSLTPESSQST